MASEQKTVSDFQVMDAMAKANKDLSMYPDILEMKAVKKGARVTMGVPKECMQKISKSVIQTGPDYMAVLLVVNIADFKAIKEALTIQGTVTTNTENDR